MGVLGLSVLELNRGTGDRQTDRGTVTAAQSIMPFPLRGQGQGHNNNNNNNNNNNTGTTVRLADIARYS